MARIFISYRRADARASTERIIDRLRQHFRSDEIFQDVNTIPGGVDFVQYTKDQLAQAEVFIPIIGPNWASSLNERADDPDDYVRFEIEEALSKGLTVIPVGVEGIKNIKKTDLPKSIQHFHKNNLIQVRPDPDFDNDVQKLVDEISKHVSADVVKTEPAKIFGLPQKQLILFSCLGILGLLGFIFALSSSGEKKPKKLVCTDHKLGILVANFQEMEHDGFANSVATEMDIKLPNDIYDVRPVGVQSRAIPRYEEHVREAHFKSQCDTNGLFVNGFYSKEQSVFNLYPTMVDMPAKVPVDIPESDAIILANPANMEFSIRDDASYVAEFLVAYIYLHSGKDSLIVASLKLLGSIAEKNNPDIDDEEFMNYLAFLAGNAYALRGDDVRASKQYDVSARTKNPELKSAVTTNRQVAKNISKGYQADPRFAKIRESNIVQHGSLEHILVKLLLGVDIAGWDIKKTERGLDKIVNTLFGKKKKKK